jgi:hypothetical protein
MERDHGEHLHGVWSACATLNPGRKADSRSYLAKKLELVLAWVGLKLFLGLASGDLSRANGVADHSAGRRWPLGPVGIGGFLCADDLAKTADVQASLCRSAREPAGRPDGRASNTEGLARKIGGSGPCVVVFHSSISSSFAVRALRQERAASQELVRNILHLSPA